MKSLVFTSDRFGFEPEITARLAQADASNLEIAISYSGRTYAEGKKITWRDGIAAFWQSSGSTWRSRRGQIGGVVPSTRGSGLRHRRLLWIGLGLLLAELVLVAMAVSLTAVGAGPHRLR